MDPNRAHCLNHPHEEEPSCLLCIACAEVNAHLAEIVAAAA